MFWRLTTKQNYSAFQNGTVPDIFMKRADGSNFEGVVWPGSTVFPDWVHPETQSYWNDDFATFFSPEPGVDISGLWIDMNEAAKYGISQSDGCSANSQ